MRRRRLVSAAAGMVCLIATAGAGASPAPAAQPVPLTSSVVVRGTRSASIDVRLNRPVTLGPGDLFNATPTVFDSDRAGAGYALVNVEHAHDPPTLVGVLSPGAVRNTRMQLAFGRDRSGKEVLETLRLPAGRYRLYFFTPGGATTVRFRLPGLDAGTRSVAPARRETVELRRADASPVTVTGSVLADTRSIAASQTLAVTTVTARITAPRGYESYWCAYEGGDPPVGQFLPRCLGADHGTGVGNALPAVAYDYAGLSAFVGLPRGRWALSRSVEAVGRVEGQTSYFVWIPMPLAARSGEARPSMVTVAGR